MNQKQARQNEQSESLSDIVARRRRRSRQHLLATAAGTLCAISLFAWQLKQATDELADLPGYRTMIAADHHGLADYRALPAQKSIIALGNSVSTWLDWHKLQRQLERAIEGEQPVRVVNFTRPAQSPADYTVLLARNPHPEQSFYFIQAPDRVIAPAFSISNVGTSELLALETVRALGVKNWPGEAGAAGLAQAWAIHYLPGYDAVTTYRRAHDYIYGSSNGLFVQRQRLRAEFPELGRQITPREELLDLVFQHTRYPRTAQGAANSQIGNSAERHLAQWRRALAQLVEQRAAGWLFFAPSRDHAVERSYRNALRELLHSASPLPFSDLSATEAAGDFVDDVHLQVTNRWLRNFLWQTERQALSNFGDATLREIPAGSSGLRLTEEELPAAAVRFAPFVSSYAPASFLRSDVLLSYSGRLVPRVDNDLAFAPEKIPERYDGHGQAYNVLPNTFTLIDLQEQPDRFRMWRLVPGNADSADPGLLNEFRFFELRLRKTGHARLHRLFWNGRLIGEAGTQEPDMNLGAWYYSRLRAKPADARDSHSRIVLALRRSALANLPTPTADGLELELISRWQPPAQAMLDFLRK